MRRIVPTTLSLMALATAIGCAQANPATKPLLDGGAAAQQRIGGPAAPVRAAAITEPARALPVATVRTVAGPGADTAAEAANDTPTLAVPGAPAPVDEAGVPEAPMVDLASLAAQMPRRSAATGEAGAQNILDPWRPYGVGVMTKTATSVTLAWRTDLDSKAIVYFGKSFGLSRNGYDGVWHVTDSAKLHQVTITGLSRFRSYTFTVIGTGALGMQFPTYPFKTRTHLF